MYPTVKVTQPGRSDLYLTIAEPLVIGRECDGLLLADEKVSREHLRLNPAGSGVLVTDLGSTNGSFLDQIRITGEATLGAGSHLTLGDTTIVVETPRPPAAVSQPTRRDIGGTIVATINPGSTNNPHPGPSGLRSSDQVVRPSPAAEETRRTSMDELVASFGDQISLPSGSGDDTVTIMFSDIESSTEHALRSGDHRWYEILTWHNQLVEQQVAAHAGFIVKNQGDGFMITFNSARRAIICASEIQQALHRQAVADPVNAVRIRIGMHTGEAIRQDSGDLFGRHVIIAARVGAMAEGGQILVSSIVREIASARGDLHFGHGELVELKGVGDQMVYPVLWGAELPTK
ncbi:MAG: adenylate/guanylate cyclase domain-containing protein [Acidimicrobiales bacterium]|nr:adenylate/guanylate cyclase domain-containing protein [Acidimicrobiales bacterium]